MLLLPAVLFVKLFFLQYVLFSDYVTKTVLRKRKSSENDNVSTKLRNHFNNIKEDLENKRTRRKNCYGNRGTRKRKFWRRRTTVNCAMCKFE